MNAQIEQVLKRLQDMLKLQSALLEQLSELGWITKDVIEDLVLALNDEHSSIRDLKEGEASQAPGLASRGNP